MLEEHEAAAYHACLLGLRDYVDKNRFPGVVMGLSGGVDSALVAALAVDALGPERVHCIMLPYRYTSNESLADAAACAEALGVRYDIIPIAPAVEGFGAMLEAQFRRARQGHHRGKRAKPCARHDLDGPLQQVWLPGADDGQQERNVGRLCHALWRHERRLQSDQGPLQDRGLPPGPLAQSTASKGWPGPRRPRHSGEHFQKAPTAELRENQKDQDSLPPYDVLDDILGCLVEQEMSLADIVARGHPLPIVKKVERLLYLAEYKRRQAAPGVKISARNFGRDRRYPITNRFREPVEASLMPEVERRVA